MILVEKHIIRSGKYFNQLMEVTRLSKNLYNSGLYAVRQHYFEYKKFLNYVNLNNMFVEQKQQDYYKLPAKVSQQTLKMVEQNFKSFFGLLKSEKTKKVKIPKYLDKNSSFLTIWTNQAVSLKKKGYLKLSGTDVYIKTDIDHINQVRVVPRNNELVVEILYEVRENDLKKDNGKYSSIDLGINNLMTLSGNTTKPIIVNGKPLKSINQYYNKKKSEIQGKLETINKTKKSKKLNKLTNKRNNKINDYLHKSSKIIINHLVSKDICTLIVGYNQYWKQEINIGKKNNQNFVSIPYLKLLNMLEYKCKKEGINFVKNEESYTSKCSFIDGEEIKKHTKYLGKRIKRGLFESASGKLINADLNGSLNILKKVVGEFQYPIEVCSTPKVINLA
jgi:putative transposase